MAYTNSFFPECNIDDYFRPEVDYGLYQENNSKKCESFG